MNEDRPVKSPYNFKVPPHDLEAEKALLGALMVRADSLYEVVDTITPDSFYAEKHRIIFRVMLELLNKNEPIDLLTVSSKLKEIKKLESVGGASYLAELSNSVPSIANAKHYAEIVQKKNALRNLISVAEDLSEMGYSEHEDLDITFDKVGKKLTEITTIAKRKFSTLKESVMEAWERLDKLHKSKEDMRGIPTGFKGIDNKLAGLQKSDLIILAARPSMGKTSFALDIARNSALKHNTAVGIFSLEMSSQQLVDKMLAAESRVDAWKLRTGRVSSDEEFTLIRDAMDRLSKAPIFIDDNPNNNIMQIKSSARKMMAERNLDLIIIDYLQLMVPRRSAASLVEQVTEISRSLKGLARELDVPVLALSQLSRAVEQRGGKPKLSDLRDSGSIEQDADVVMFIHRNTKDEDHTKDEMTEILIEKHRNGPTGKVDLYFDPKRVSFSEVEKADFGSF